MSAYNIRQKFSYYLATSSLDYVRNYNFNALTVTDIPLVLSNLDETVPITVNMTTTDSWLRIVNPQDNKNLIYPIGNVVLLPSSSKTVTVKIDLPPEIEQSPEIVIYPSIYFELTTGSNLIQTPTPPDTTPKNKIIAPSDITMDINEIQTVVIRAFDLDGLEEDGGQVTWTIEDTSIAQLVYEREDIQNYGALNQRRVKGLTAGTTKILYTSRDISTETLVTVNETVIAGSGPQNVCGIRCRTADDCSGTCSYCADGVCSETPTEI